MAEPTPLKQVSNRLFNSSSDERSSIAFQPGDYVRVRCTGYRGYVESVDRAGIWLDNDNCYWHDELFRIHSAPICLTATRPTLADYRRRAIELENQAYLLWAESIMLDPDRVDYWKHQTHWHAYIIRFLTPPSLPAVEIAPAPPGPAVGFYALMTFNRNFSNPCFHVERKVAVVGKEGEFVIIRDEGCHIRLHPAALRPTNEPVPAAEMAKPLPRFGPPTPQAVR